MIEASWVNEMVAQTHLIELFLHFLQLSRIKIGQLHLLLGHPAAKVKTKRRRPEKCLKRRQYVFGWWGFQPFRWRLLFTG